jgi:hypothetical protein
MIGESVFGVTAKSYNEGEVPGFPTASSSQQVPFGGLYGAGAFGYSLPQTTASFT